MSLGNEQNKWTKKILVYLLAGGGVLSTGGLGSTALINYKIENKVNRAEFTRMETLIVSLSCNMCLLQGGSANECEKIRHDYYNAHPSR